MKSDKFADKFYTTVAMSAKDNQGITLCTLENFCLHFSCLLIFSNQLFHKKFFLEYFWNIIRLSNSLDPDQAQQFVGPDLGLNCLQKLLSDDTSRRKINQLMTSTSFDKQKFSA